MLFIINLIYIPLCFLLIHDRVWEEDWQTLIYIPLCFLLIRTAFIPSEGHKFDLHSTMFSINLKLDMSQPEAFRIYIPLCFLLIATADWEITRLQQHLHSTMFSINPLRSSE